MRFPVLEHFVEIVETAIQRVAGHLALARERVEADQTAVEVQPVKQGRQGRRLADLAIHRALRQH
ncbi:MAG: hypothetical protein M3Y22_00580, partial [Pseudomonadota bacterium]|nr:hypothetical protein [Pseudomonadota bacterium]